ncbi:MAG TPA: choice-of-anchor L domain-containing protein, partial [Flavobacteriales bacterium]
MLRMLRSVLLSVLCGCMPVLVRAQLTTVSGVPPQQVVQNVLLGPGVTASNITFQGTPAQLGTFNGTNSNLGLGAGMIMATGPVNVAVGPNNSGSAGMGVGGPGDPDLDMIVHNPSVSTYDRAVLEFDFVPDGDSLKFRFIFASEEYIEFVNMNVNDAFGFFLSGPGINGAYGNNARNVATVPGTGVQISINTVNHLVNSTYFVNNNDGLNPPENADPYYIQFDGFTTVITARAHVQCGETYHIKLAISDAGDGIYDSAVFLEGGSFSSNSLQLAADITAGGMDSVLYEGCGAANLLIERQGNDDLQQLVELIVSGTTTPGVDHPSLPAQLIFQPGMSALNIPLDALDDGVADGLEYLDVEAVWEGDCAMDTARLRLYFDDAPPIFVTIDPDTTLTCLDSTLVQAQVTGGFGAYTVDWNQGIPDNSLQGWVTPTATTTYTVSVTDACGVSSATASMTITVPVYPPLTVMAGPDTTVLCPESPVLLSSSFNGGTPVVTTLWSNGGATTPALPVAPVSTSTWTVTVTDRCGATASDAVTVTVQYDSVRIGLPADTTICLGDTIMLRSTTQAGLAPWEWFWLPSGVVQDSLAVHPDVPIHHVVQVTDGCGITDRDTIGIGVNDPQADFRLDGSVHEDALPIRFIDQSSPTVSWWWDFGDGSDPADERHPEHRYDLPGEYLVRLAIQDTLGCVDTVLRVITVDPGFRFFLPNSFTPDGDGLNER